MGRFSLPSFALALAIASSGCHAALLGMVGGASSASGMYRAGALGDELGGASVRTLGCLDVGLALVDRPSEPQSLVQLEIGNRCGHPEALDFARIRIDGALPDGEHRAVELVDPRHEIVELHVGARERGKELVRLDASTDLLSLTFDLDAIAPDAPHAHPSAVHFARESTNAPWTAVL